MVKKHETANTVFTALAVVATVIVGYWNHKDAELAIDTANQANATAKQQEAIARQQEQDTEQAIKLASDASKTANQSLGLSIQRKVTDNYNQARDAYLNTNVSPRTYFIYFWEQQNKQIELWLNGHISDTDYQNYLNARIDEFRGEDAWGIGNLGVAGKTRFAFFDENKLASSQEFQGYDNYKDAWDTTSYHYRDQRLGKLMGELKDRANSKKRYNLDEVRHLKESLRDFPP